MLLKIGERHRETVELRRQLLRALRRAIGNKDLRRSLLHQMTCREEAHLSCADEENLPPLKRTEDAMRQIYRDGGDGHAAGSDLGLGTHFFCRRECGLEKAF